MISTVPAITMSEMEENPEKWERFEMYKGEAVEMTYTKPAHGKILGKLFYIIINWIQQKGYGEVYGGESGIKFNDQTRYSFDLGWSDTALPEDEIPTKSLPLMVEIVSDSKDAGLLLTKIEDYLEYGAKEVWIVYPKRKSIQVYYPDRTARIFHEKETIIPGDWMREFQMNPGDLF